MHISDYFILATLICFVEATTPSCRLHGNDTHNLICTSGDTDYKLMKGFLPEIGGITTITLKACRITTIDCEAFPKILTANLDLSGNKIQDLPSCVFNNLPQLVSLNLSFNNINELPQDIIDANTNIEYLDLRGNYMKTIRTGLLEKAHNLKNLDVSRNTIDGNNLSPYSFGQKTHIELLDLSQNDMSKTSEDLLQEFQSLQYLYLNQCFLKRVPSFALKNNLKTLKQLLLSTNQIIHLDDAATFVYLSNLEILNLADNAIERIVDNIFAPMRKLKTIVLRHNRLSQLPEKLFQNMPKLVTVDLAYNNIKQIEVTPFRNTPLKNLNVSGNQLSYMPKNFYVELTNSGGKLKKFLFSNNPWQCACLRDILEDVKNYGIEYNSTKYNGQESVCVFDGEFICRRQ